MTNPNVSSLISGDGSPNPRGLLCLADYTSHTMPCGKLRRYTLHFSSVYLSVAFLFAWITHSLLFLSFSFAHPFHPCLWEPTLTHPFQASSPWLYRPSATSAPTTWTSYSPISLPPIGRLVPCMSWSSFWLWAQWLQQSRWEMRICWFEINLVSFRSRSLTLRDVSSSTLHVISFFFSLRAPWWLEVQLGRGQDCIFRFHGLLRGSTPFTVSVFLPQPENTSFLCIGITICFSHCQCITYSL